MIRIIHISDPHNQSKTMERLNNLALQYKECEVIALTGDVVSTYDDQLPSFWDSWPQQYKLSVPGNHLDHSHAYDSLTKWVHQTPWVRPLDDLLFIGLGLYPQKDILKVLEDIPSYEHQNINGVVILLHEFSPYHNNSWLVKTRQFFTADCQFLILHGHNHPSGNQWTTTELEGCKYMISHVISSLEPRGTANLIEWHNTKFTHTFVYGEDNN